MTLCTYTIAAELQDLVISLRFQINRFLVDIFSLASNGACSAYVFFWK